MEERYLDTPCATWDATYENLPLADTLLWQDNRGLTLDDDGDTLRLEKAGENTLKAQWGGKAAIFGEDGIRIQGAGALDFDFAGNLAEMTVASGEIRYCYNGCQYALSVSGGRLQKTETGCVITPENGEVFLAARRR